ncbi:MAG: lipoprotein releasing system, ATP-binding protein [Nitrospinae bacterium RIFCSPLOWO2_02_FULL_39_110]|nr:MAG: lipoprotein releasing system, ATP-binding protein [Nitrospinae bacterium RIFCSPHIGHO2_02_39_11]OGW00142.1 MAG: lipoprotein releasing system, ATP-binding protein [Nitrospinae bacterium RIFCSPHIGHO2_12_FULL_39_42]OGW00325.1 MAG: lipoprotein releasing system, ATP-binding protein [Nitrospinae bacterium RIFCSPHIGHO2_02_FULL_39_82]OGW02475.1 MAG: lipoprotein releasing system, ATP-binding protein [Nitrospinae bacterium RIFCSPLOWO2_02_39_17]OGW07099.1 MAG: lipoprotein releasing system, ATP-bind
MEELIQIREVRKSFKVGDDYLEVLKGLNFSIMKGEMLGIVGVSGVGKSTLLHIIGALDRPTEGDVIFNSQGIFKMTDIQLAEFRNRKIGFVFQFHHLLPEFTALENVMMPVLISKKGKDEAIKEAKRILTEVGLRDRINHKPGQLSGGEQQRVAVARALINNPQLVLADEPTGNLDSKTSEDVYELLYKLNREMGQTFVIVTHNDTLVKRMTRVIRLADGMIVSNEQ